MQKKTNIHVLIRQFKYGQLRERERERESGRLSRGSGGKTQGWHTYRRAAGISDSLEGGRGCQNGGGQ